MPLHLPATIRSTESWDIAHFLAILVVVVTVAAVVAWLRVRRRR